MTTTSLQITFASGNVVFSGSEIISASLVENINPISVEAPTNIIRFTVFSPDADFSIISPNGFYANLKRLEPFEVNEIINGTPVYIGRFYLDEWKSESEHKASFTAFDEIGVLNDVPLNKETIIAQDIINGEFSIGEVIEELLTTLFASSASFEIAIELYSLPAYGWIKSKQSYRDALCQLAFAGGAYITCTRSNKILVKMFEFGYGVIANKIDERDASIVYVGNWTQANQGSAYLTTLKTATSTAVYPNTYFTFQFTGNRFKLDFLLGMAGSDQYGKFYVAIDGDTPIMVEKSETSEVFDSWTSPMLVNGIHNITVYGWVTGTEAEGYSPILFDAITTYEQSFDSGIYDNVITAAQKGIASPVEQRQLVTGVKVIAHNYIWDGTSNITVYKGTLSAGTYTIEFNEPHANYQATGATIDFYGIDWVTFTVSTLGEVSITGRKYVDSQTAFSVHNENLPTGTRENIVEITDVPFVHPNNVQEIVARIYNYYQQQLIQKIKLFVPSDVVGDLVLADTQAQKQISGIIEHMETNLTGGFVSNVEIVGSIEPEIEEDMSNVLINNGFDLAQRQTPGTLTTISQDAYSADQWRISRENTDLQYQRNDAHAESGLTSRYYGSFKKITSTGKFMVYQILEGINSAPLKGRTIVFQARMKASSSKTIKMAILELQNGGTMDSIPATFVSAWGANGVNPTLGSNLAIITAAQSKSVTTAWQNFSVSVTVPTNSKNIIVALWSDSQFAANDILHVAEAGLYISNTVQTWKPRPFAQELLLCQRYYWKTFALDTAPAQNAGLNTEEFRAPAPVAGANTQRLTKCQFPVTMRAVPTVTLFNPAAANANVRDATAAADCSSPSTTAFANGILISCTGNASTAVGGDLRVHITADAKL